MKVYSYIKGDETRFIIFVNFSFNNKVHQSKPFVCLFYAFMKLQLCHAFYKKHALTCENVCMCLFLERLFLLYITDERLINEKQINRNKFWISIIFSLIHKSKTFIEHFMHSCDSILN